MDKIPVVSISPDGTKTRYSSMIAAAKAIHASIGQISKAVNFGSKCHGMTWEKVGDRNGTA